jgi:hypothetical protein
VDERLQRILDGIPEHELSRVAAGVLGLTAARIDGRPTLSEITTPHAEDRTIGIVKVSGTAGGRPWASVVKIVDLAVPEAARVAGVTAPQNEEIVYEEGYFASDGLPFRPARCYGVSRPGEALKVIWLEDLTGATPPPFSLDQIAQVARQIGEWNGRQAAEPQAVAFAVGQDAYIPRLRRFMHVPFLEKLRALDGTPLVRAMYGDQPIDIAFTFFALMQELLDRNRALPHSLCFGDCSAGNLFVLGNETVAVDWASLTNDPLGCDGGCSVGSCFTWGPDYAEVLVHERELFTHYLDGLSSTGWRFDPLDVRRAAFGQLGHYLCNTLEIPVIIGETAWSAYIEKRYGLPLPEIPERGRRAIEMMPSYVEELRELLA